MDSIFLSYWFYKFNVVFVFYLMIIEILCVGGEINKSIFEDMVKG